MILIVLVISTIIIIGYFLLKKNNEYWDKRGVPGPKPKLIVGNTGASFLMKKSPGEIFVDIYNDYQNFPIVGAYRASTPVLIIRNPELIKEITIKSFSSFRDNDIEIDKKNDPLFGRNPFCLKGEEWKIVRAQLTPGFTSGKMKWLYPHLEENSKNLVKFIQNQPETTNGKGYEAKELCTRFTLNNVATCAFGLEGKCFEEENSEFRQLAKDFLTPGSWTMVMFFIRSLVPKLTKIFPLSFTTKKVEKKLIQIVSQTLKYRQENNIVRNDFLHIISQLKTTCKDYAFTDLDVTAHAAGFFGDGYETSSLAMSYILFQLANNTEAQDKLREEVLRKFEENGDKLPYEVLQEMQYLDAVFCETLRLHPVVYNFQKTCTNTYTLTTEDGKVVAIEKGTPIILPIYGLHLDPKYFDDPKSFKPERFLGFNRDNIQKCAYMPFGEGPRACLGQRFGILQIKIGVTYIIKHYTLSVNKRTQLPLKYIPLHPMLVPVGGLWLNFNKI